MYIKIIKILKYTEKKYYENKIKNNNIKNTWRTLNKVIGNNKKSGTIIDNKLTDLQNANKDFAKQRYNTPYACNVI